MTKEIVLVLRKNTGGKHVCRTAADAPSGVSKVGHGPLRFLVSPLLGHLVFFLRLTFTVNNFRPAIY